MGLVRQGYTARADGLPGIAQAAGTSEALCSSKPLQSSTA